MRAAITAPIGLIINPALNAAQTAPKITKAFFQPIVEEIILSKKRIVFFKV